MPELPCPLPRSRALTAALFLALGLGGMPILAQAAPPAPPPTPASDRVPVAVVDFRAIGVPGEFGEAVAENFRNSLAHLKRYTVVERSQIQQALKEQSFGQSGLVDAKQAVTLGRLLGAKIIVVGSITKIGSTYTLNTRFIDVGTGETKEAESLKTRDEDQIANLVDQLASTLSGTGPVAAVPPAVTGATLPPPGEAAARPLPTIDPATMDLIAKKSHVIPNIDGKLGSLERVVCSQYTKTFQSGETPPGSHDTGVYLMNTGQALYIAINSQYDAGNDTRFQLMVDGNHNRLADGGNAGEPIDFFFGIAGPDSHSAYNLYGVRRGEEALCATPSCNDPPPRGFQRAAAANSEGKIVYEFAIPFDAMGARLGDYVRMGFVNGGGASEMLTTFFPSPNASGTMAAYYQNHMASVYLQPGH